MCTVKRVLYVMAAVLAAAATTEAAKTLPDKRKIEAAQRLVRDTYRDELASEDGLRRVIDAADALADDVDQIAVYLTVAQRAAANLWIREGFEAIDRVAARFDYDGLEAKSVMLEGAAKRAKGDDRISVVNRALELLDEACSQGRFDIGEKAIKIAGLIVGRLRDAQLRKDMASKRRAFDALKKERDATAKQLEDARAMLKRSPADPQVNDRVGRGLAVRNEWPSALAHMARSADERVRSVAASDMAGPTDAALQLALADAWWDVADRAAGRESVAFRSRAVHWYSMALPSLTGLQKMRVSKRIEDAGDEASDAAALQAGAGGTAFDLLLSPTVTLHLAYIGDGGRRFWIATTETTEAQWCAIMGGMPANANLPKVGISFNEAVRYCEAISAVPGSRRYRLRLPTVEEMAYVAGDLDQYGLDGAWWRENSPERLQPVGRKAANRQGLFDLLGNAWEFASDGRFYGWSAWDSRPKAGSLTPCQLPRDYRGEAKDYVGGNVGFRIAAELR